MQVKDVMTQSCQFIHPDSTLKEAARTMRDLDCGFLPIGSETHGKLEGVITDRDITIRAVAEGIDPAQIHVKSVETRDVLYCYETDDLETAASSMRDNQVHRLIVLDNPDSKQLRGVISLGDILRHQELQLGAETARGIVSSAA